MWKMLERKKTVDCQHVEAALMAYLKDGLSPRRRQAIEAHLAACDACTRSVQQARTLEAELRLQAARHNPTLSPQAAARIHEWVYRRMRRALIMQRTIKLAGVAVAVVAIASVAVGAMALWQDMPSEVANAPESGVGAGDTWTRPADGAVMVYVPAGEFLMGSTDDDPYAAPDEKPQHTVNLDAFWIDKTEVTNAQYRKCVEAGACEEPPCWNLDKYSDPEQPVVCVTWEAARAYAAWAGGRLPTEAEWEKAARGTDGRIYPWGDSAPDCSKANYGGCADKLLPVGSHPDGASPYGVLDMAGNVLEWVADWYDYDYYSRSPDRSPPGPDTGDRQILRGGSFLGNQHLLRCADRILSKLGYLDSDVGFRVVVTPGSSGP